MSLEIKDKGIILSANKYSENSLIIKVLSKDHGIFSGFIKGAISNKKNLATYQIANLVDFTWKSKSVENLGFFQMDLARSYLGKIIFSNLKLNCVKAIFRLIQDNILEREPHHILFEDLLYFLNQISEEKDEKFLSNYIKLELNLLKTLGYGIDLSECALTGVKDDLYFISPKSGRAASKKAGMQYQEKLLRLPGFLTNKKAVLTKEEVFLGLELSNFFLQKYLLENNQRFFELRSAIIQLAKQS